MKTIGLIGFPLGHSFSRKYFTEKFEKERIEGYEYRNFELPAVEQVPEMVRETPGLIGFNVTIPYKQRILPYLDEVDAAARKIGAVNCVKVEHAAGLHGKCGDGVFLTGYNTDVYGFKLSLLDMLGDRRPDALVLGTGGASLAVRAVLEELGIAYRSVSRTGRGEVLSYASLTAEETASRLLIVNATPLGTFPNTETAADIPYDALTGAHCLYDLVYNPSDTRFTREGRRRGATVMSGYMMLKQQAEKGWEIFTAK